METCLVSPDECMRLMSRGRRGGGFSRRGGGDSGFSSPAGLPGILHWYRADSGITIATGVSQWNDIIGSAHLLQGTLALQPSYNATDAAYNNQPTIQAASAGPYLSVTATASTQAFAVWVVGEALTAGQVLASTGTGGTVPIVYNVGGNFRSNAGTDLASGVAATAKHAILAVFNGASSFIGVDNWLTGGVSGNAGAGNGTAIGVLAYSSGTFPTAGKIAELIISAGVPSASSIRSMARYMGPRYGISIS